MKRFEITSKEYEEIKEQEKKVKDKRTSQNLRILMLRYEGKKVKEIAEQMRITENTVSRICMRYRQQGLQEFMRQKYTSHYMTNPLKHYDTACAKCHDESYETMLHRVQTINDNTFKVLRIAGQTTARAHKVIKAAKLAGATDEQLAESRQLVRQAQWFWDWVSAESSMGFHNPDKMMRSLGISIDAAHKAIESATAAVKGGELMIEPMPTEPFTDTKFADAIMPGKPAPAPAPAPAPMPEPEPAE